MPVDDREWDQHHRVVRDRLNWTAVLANGALIVAIVGGAMQASDPVKVLGGFSLSLFLFGLGAGAGLASAELALSGDQEWKRGTAWWEDPDGLAKKLAAMNARMIELHVAGTLVENAAEVKALAAKVGTLGEAAQAEGRASIERVRRSQRLNRAAQAMRVASMLLCAAGFGWFLWRVRG